MNSNSTDIQSINSLSFADVSGVYHGLERLLGESNRDFVVRLARAATAERSATYQGLINELSIQFGLEVQPAITVMSSDSGMVLAVKRQVLTVSTNGKEYLTPLFSVDADTMLVWKRLSDVVTALQAIPGMSARLLTADGPALQLVEQSNLDLAVAEAVPAATNKLAFSPVIVGSEQFSTSVPSYSLDANGNLQFATLPDAGTTVTYLYRLDSYSLLTSEAVMIPLAYCPLAVPGATIPHQVREAVAYIMGRDLSYWSK
jgi:hypothetical protein